MTTVEVMAELDRLIGEAAPDELPALLGRLEAASAQAWVRLMAQAAATAHTPAEPEREEGRLLTPDEASNIAQVPVRRIYAWAQGQRWASRPSRRCLRVEEAGFRRWLARRTY